MTPYSARPEDETTAGTNGGHGPLATANGQSTSPGYARLGPDRARLPRVRPRRPSPGIVAANVVFAVLGLMFFLPLVWMLFAAFDQTASGAIELPHLSLDNFAAIFSAGLVFGPFGNSLYLAGVATVVATALALLAAYPLSRRRLPFKRPFLYIILFATGLPVGMLLVPVYSMFVRFHMLNSLTFTALFLAATSTPFAIWLLKNFIDSIPFELEEAAQIDGASSLNVLWHVVVPLTLPGISVAGVFTFISTWSAFLTPYILLISPDKLPGSITIYQSEGAYGLLHYGQLAADSLLFSLPVVILYWAVSRHFQGAFNFGGGLKG